MKKNRNQDTEKIVLDDASSMTSGGAHVKSVQNELKANANYVPEMSGIGTSDEEDFRLDKMSSGVSTNPLDKEVIHSK